MIAFFDPFRDITMPAVLLRLVFAIVFGGIVGLERGSKKRAAGFRTYMLVCLGAALVMLTNQYVSNYYGGSDMSRLGAQVISGIGFLGAGTIVITRQNNVVGLTTAAGLWACACVGLAIGIGFYEGAIIAAVSILLIITLMHKIESKAIQNAKTMMVYVELVESGKLSRMIQQAQEMGISVKDMDFTWPKYSKESGHVAVLLTLRLPKRQPHFQVVEQFRELEEITYIEEI